MDFCLLDSQKPHNERCLNLLNSHHFFFDNSVMGTGKTYNYVHCAKTLCLKLFVVSPKTTHFNVKKVAESAGVELACLITPQSLASKKNCQPKHGFLKRYDKPKKPVVFKTTHSLRSLIKQGCLFVFDEVQFARNINTWFRACCAITRSVGLFTSNVSDNSYCAFVSTTPTGYKNKWVHFMMLIGLISKVKTCGRKIDKDIVNDINKFLVNEGIKHEDAILTINDVFNVFIEHIKPVFFSSMPLIMEYKTKCFNGFYKVEDKKEEEKLVVAVGALSSVHKQMNENGKMTTDIFRLLTKIRMSIEKAKIPIFKKIISQELESNENNKIVICAHFNNTIDTLYSHFKEYKPLKLTGKVSNPNREKIVAKFQKPTNKTRLLICNLKVGGVGISLHDMDGRFPRTMFLSPDYNVNDLFQGIGRVNRVNSKSESKVILVYGNISSNEKNILKAISERFTNIKKTFNDDVASEFKLPMDFPGYIEGDPKFKKDDIKDLI